MAQLDGSLQRLVLLDAFLKGQVGELQGIRGEEGRREGRSTWDPARKVFIGGLKSSMGRIQLKEVFSQYGSVRNCWVAKKPGGFGFVEMGSVRGAERAVRGLDGTQVWGKQVRVAMSHPKENNQQGKETEKKEWKKADGEDSERRMCQGREERSRDGLNEQKKRKERSRSSEDKVSKYERKRLLDKDRTRQYIERDEKERKDLRSPDNEKQYKSHQYNNELTEKKGKSEDRQGSTSDSLTVSRTKTNMMNEDRRRHDGVKKEESRTKSRRRSPSSSSSSSNSTSDWEAPWERIEDDRRKKRKWHSGKV